MVTNPNWMAPFHIARATDGPLACIPCPRVPGPAASGRHLSASAQRVLQVDDEAVDRDGGSPGRAVHLDRDPMGPGRRPLAVEHDASWLDGGGLRIDRGDV